MVVATRTKTGRVYHQHKFNPLRNFGNYKNRTKNNFKTLVSFMHANPIRVNTNLYRGTSASFIRRLLTNGYLDNNRLTPFTRTRNIAKTFTQHHTNNTGQILVLEPGRYPAINERRYKGHSSENEITLAPGRYILMGYTPAGNLKVKYIPAPLRQSIRL
jgi:hypothetical protein